MTNATAITGLNTVKNDLEDVINPKITGLQEDSDKLVENVDAEISDITNLDQEAEYGSPGHLENFQNQTSALDARILPA